MEAVKIWTVLKACAVIALAVGLFLALGAALGSDRTDTFSIPAGLWTYQFETVTLLDGSVSGTFDVRVGDNVTLFVFNQTEYDRYVSVSDRGPIPLDTASGITGSFSASQKGLGKLYIVLEHEEGTEGVLTNGTMDYRITGLTVSYFIVGIVLTALAPVLWFLGVRARKKKIQEKPSTSKGIAAAKEGPKS
jgi:hypothetical protein